MPRRLPFSLETSQFWTTDEIDLAMSRLERRIHDIEALHADRMCHRDAHVRDVEQSTRDTVHEIFGIASQEFYRHEFFKIDNGPLIMSAHGDDLDALDERRQAQFVERIPGAVTRIRGLVDSLEAKR